MGRGNCHEHFSSRPGVAGNLIQVLHGQGGQTGYSIDPLDVDMFCIYRNTLGTSSGSVSSDKCPVRLGRVARVCLEVDPPVAVVESFWPILKPHKFGDRLNLFGTWQKSSRPMGASAGPPDKKQTVSAWTATQCIMVQMADILVWPIEVEDGPKDVPHGVRIPLAVFEYLRDVHAIDLALPMWTFADRGKSFYERVMWRHHSDAQPPP